MRMRLFLLALGMLIGIGAGRVEAKSLDELQAQYKSALANSDTEGLWQRLDAIEGLMEHNSVRSLEFLREHIEKEPNIRVNILMARALAKLDMPESIDPAIAAAVKRIKLEGGVYQEIADQMIRGLQRPETIRHVYMKKLLTQDKALTPLLPIILSKFIQIADGEADRKEIERASKALFSAAKTPKLDEDVFDEWYNAAIGCCQIRHAEFFDEIVPQFLKHKDHRVRLALAEGLRAFVADANAEDARRGKSLEHLTALLNDNGSTFSWLVRETAAYSLGAATDADAAMKAFIARGPKEDRLRVSGAIRDILQKLTGKDFGFDWTMWEKYRVSKEAGGTAPSSSYVKYFYQPIVSNRLIFIIDISGSMEAASDGKSRIERAKEELINVINSLDDKTVTFNIYAYNSSPMRWQKTLVRADEANKKAAVEWIKTRAPGSNTNTMDTLAQAFTEEDVDTIFLLSDGIPTAGKYTLPEKIGLEIDKVNRYRRVKINTIALLNGAYDSEKDADRNLAARFLKMLAEQNQGSFVDIRK